MRNQQVSFNDMKEVLRKDIDLIMYGMRLDEKFPRVIVYNLKIAKARIAINKNMAIQEIGHEVSSSDCCLDETSSGECKFVSICLSHTNKLF